MSVFVGGVYAKNLIDRLGIGVTINSGTGELTLVTGPEICRVTADPNGNTTANSGSLALQQSNGTSALWINTSVGSGTTWIAVGGSTVTNFLNDVVETFGTTSPLQIQQVYVSASNRFDLRGVAVSQATTQASSAIRFATGADTITGAVVGGASGAVEILSGATNSTNPGGTAGASGAISISTGASTASAGLSGNSGALLLSTGNSASANSGSITIQTGTAVGTRGSLIIQAAAVTYSTQAVQHTVFDNSTAAYSMGSTGALDMLVFDTLNGAERLIINAKNGLSLPNNTNLSVGTTSSDAFTFSYSSGTNTGALSGTSVTAPGGASRPLTITTGGTVNNAAVAGGNAGAITITTGGTDVTDAGGTGGTSGALTLTTGNAISTAGTGSGATGAVLVSSGASTDGNSGAVTLSSGNAAVLGGGVASGGVGIATGSVGFGTTGSITIATGGATGAGTSGSIFLSPGSTVGGTRGTVQATGLRTISDSAAAITTTRVLTAADSGGAFTVAQSSTYVTTLPTPAGAGLRFTFCLVSPGAFSPTIVSPGGGVTFVGTIVNDVTSVLPATGSTLTFVTGTAALGDNIEVISLSATLYLVRAVSSAAGGITIT